LGQAVRREVAASGKQPPGSLILPKLKRSFQFFVDTNAKPARSIWHHPYDDDEYLSTLSSSERERVQHHHPTMPDIAAEETDDEYEYHDTKQPHANQSSSAALKTAGVSSATASSSKGKESFGQKMKDKLTGSTHAEREKERAKRAEDEQKAYQRHQALRQAMNRAIETGQPQLIGKDAQGHDLYLEPPEQQGGGYGMRPANGQYNPYASGPYQNPNARFLKPDYGYNRPGGYGYGMGYGMPLMMPMMLGGGLGLGMGMGMGGFGGGF